MTERTYVTTITSDFPLSYITRQPCAGFAFSSACTFESEAPSGDHRQKSVSEKFISARIFRPTTDRTTEGRKSEQQSGGMLVSSPLAYFCPEVHELRLSRSVVKGLPAIALITVPPVVPPSGYSELHTPIQDILDPPRR